jgi:hypothetical protein
MFEVASIKPATIWKAGGEGGYLARVAAGPTALDDRQSTSTGVIPQR